MWKYVTRRFRDTFEKSANHFDKRPTTNVVNSAGNINDGRNQRCAGGIVPCPVQAWFHDRNCLKKSERGEHDTYNNKWNYEQLERSANHFDKRPTTNVVNSAGIINDGRNQRCAGGIVPCPVQAWFRDRKCFKKSKRGEHDTNNNKWNYEQLNRTWIGAITWSSALALGWYTSQLIHLKLKHLIRDDKQCVNNLITTLKPYVNSVNNRALFGNTSKKIEKILEEFTPTVHLVANEHNGENNQPGSSSSTDTHSSDSDLGDVLNSIENKLGLAAIDSGQYHVGLTLLRSAATRHHAPAMFNLGLCYEMGLGVSINEKTAMELYRSAAALQHPGALYNLGIYYGQGRGGLHSDMKTATRLLRLAAVQGQTDAINALKSLDIEVEPSQDVEDIWIDPKKSTLDNDSIIPSPTTLFVENLFFVPQHS